MAATLALMFALGGTVIRPYVAPKLDPEPEISPSDTKVVQIAPSSGEWDATVLARPSFVAPLVGHVLRGAKLGVRGQVATPTSRTCAAKFYWALEPFGYICASETRPTNDPKTIEPVLQLVGETPLPYKYAMVLVAEGELLPMWASVSDLRSHVEPERQLARGDTVAIESLIEFEGQSYYVTVDDKVLPTTSTKVVENYSQWQGISLEGVHLPFGWVTPEKGQVFDAPDGKKIGQVLRREKLDIFEEVKIGRKRWLRIGDGRWMKSGDLNEVRQTARPTGTGTHPQWFDVDLGEQTVVAYQNDTPVYATLTASGREPNHTPLGNYPIWGKATAITMKSQEYDDIPYYVNKVPWVMFFQAHNALHGAYWHDRFGITKSHGCVNLSPRDARAIFDWLEPALPPGWTSVRYYDLTQAPVAHIHNTGKTRPFFQERNIGPPDKNDEADRVNAAVARREAEAAAAAQLQAAGAAPATPGAVVAVQPSAAPAVPAAPVVTQ
ncbi:MAG TPA: L,D-transpeptidase [Polyangiales bacterium]|nr:L,D-transpeptidase [Polyangiales bacterium]